MFSSGSSQPGPALGDAAARGVTARLACLPLAEVYSRLPLAEVYPRAEADVLLAAGHLAAAGPAAPVVVAAPLAHRARAIGPGRPLVLCGAATGAEILGAQGLLPLAAGVPLAAGESAGLSSSSAGGSRLLAQPGFL